MPGSLSISSRPCMTRTSSSVRARPRPTPSNERSSPVSACQNGSSARSSCSSSMPIPVSRTLRRTPPSSVGVRSSVTEPPAGVNFTALPSRLIRICFSRRSSEAMEGNCDGMWKLSVTPPFSARPPTITRLFLQMVSRSSGQGVILMLSSSMRDRSRISFTSVSRCDPASWMSLMYWA